MSEPTPQQEQEAADRALDGQIDEYMEAERRKRQRPGQREREDRATTLRMIRDDCRADTKALEGQPYIGVGQLGKIVAVELGKVRAMIHALANVLDELNR